MALASSSHSLASWHTSRQRHILSLIPLAILGLYGARVLYELEPARLALLGDWPGVITFVLLVVAVAAALCLLLERMLSLAPAAGAQPWPFVLTGLYVVWPSVDLRWAGCLLAGSLALIALARMGTHRPERVLGSGLALAALALYLLTLGDQVGRGDTFEFQVVATQLGIAHPTGYPLYTLIGKLFSLLPFGAVAWRVNLTSALSAAFAVLLLFRLLLELLDHPDRWEAAAAALSAFVLAVTPVFWRQAVVAEVYALNALLVVIILWLLARLVSGKVGNEKATRRTLYLLFFVTGLAVTHHLTSVVLPPAIGLALLLSRPRLPLRSWLAAGGWLLLGLTPWLYIPLRWPFLNRGAMMTPGQLSEWLLGQRFAGALNLFGWTDPVRWQIVSRIVLEQFGPFGVALALAGVFVLLRRSWRTGVVALAAAGGYLVYALVYNVPDIDVFLIPLFLVMTVWIGMALAELVCSVKGAARRARWPLADLTPGLLVSVLILLPLTLLSTNYAIADQRGKDADLEDWGRYVLSLPLPPHSAILVDSEKIAPLYYLQVTEGIRPDLDIAVLGDEALYRQEVDRRIGAGQSVFLYRFLPGLAYHLRSFGPLVEVRPTPLQEPPPDMRRMDAVFGTSIQLDAATLEQGPPLRLTLAWQALTPSRPDYHLRLRLVDGAGTVWWEDRGNHPVQGYYPTGAWRQNEVVTDYHEIIPDASVPEGDYEIQVSWFVPWKTDHLTADGRTWLPVASLHYRPLPAPPLEIETRASQDGGALVLTSHEALDLVPAGRLMGVHVDSLAKSPPVPAGLSVVAIDGSVQSRTDNVIYPGQSRLTFPVPEHEGDYALRLGLPRPMRCSWLAPLTPDCALGSFRVIGGAPGSYSNLDDSVLLTHALVDSTTARPGESMRVELRWQGLKRMEADYTVFVHLVGPDGRLHGQVDQYPVEGTLPTSTWSAGQVVADIYTVALEQDAPAGKYQVQVGMYLLGTLRRLPVLDTSGAPIDDHVMIGEFTVP